VLSSAGFTMQTRRSGIKLVCDRDDLRIIPTEILNFGDYDAEELNVISFLLSKIENKHPVVFDIGSNIGWYSLNIAQNMRNAKVYAFEPIPKTFRYLEKNINLNGVTNIQCFNHGFSDEEKEICFHYYKEGSGNASLAKLCETSSLESVPSRVLKLDSFVKENGITIDFIKCDVEGAELLVFKGGIKTLKEQKPIVYTEMLRKWAAKFDYHPNDIINLFASLEYKCFVISGHKLEPISIITEDTVATNFVFIHASLQKLMA
jgi:FkbM family methyltransferase